MALVEVKRLGKVLEQINDNHYDRDDPATFRTWLQAGDIAGHRGSRVLPDGAKHKEFARKLHSHPQDIRRRSIRQNSPNSYSFCEMM